MVSWCRQRISAFVPMSMLLTASCAGQLPWDLAQVTQFDQVLYAEDARNVEYGPRVDCDRAISEKRVGSCFEVDGWVVFQGVEDSLLGTIEWVLDGNSVVAAIVSPAFRYLVNDDLHLELDHWVFGGSITRATESAKEKLNPVPDVLFEGEAFPEAELLSATDVPDVYALFGRDDPRPGQRDLHIDRLVRVFKRSNSSMVQFRDKAETLAAIERTHANQVEATSELQKLLWFVGAKNIPELTALDERWFAEEHPGKTRQEVAEEDNANAFFRASTSMIASLDSDPRLKTPYQMIAQFWRYLKDWDEHSSHQRVPLPENDRPLLSNYLENLQSVLQQAIKSAREEGRLATAAYYSRALLLIQGRASEPLTFKQALASGDADLRDAVRMALEYYPAAEGDAQSADLAEMILRIARSEAAITDSGLTFGDAAEWVAAARAMEMPIVTVRSERKDTLSGYALAYDRTANYGAEASVENPEYKAWLDRLEQARNEVAAAKSQAEGYKSMQGPESYVSETTTQDVVSVGEGSDRHYQRVIRTETHVNDSGASSWARVVAEKEKEYEDAVAAYNELVAAEPPPVISQTQTRQWKYQEKVFRWNGEYYRKVYTSGAVVTGWEFRDTPESGTYVAADPAHGVSGEDTFSSSERAAEFTRAKVDRALADAVRTRMLAYALEKHAAAAKAWSGQDANLEEWLIRHFFFAAGTDLFTPLDKLPAPIPEHSVPASSAD